MNTPAHLIVGAAAFARPDAPRVTLAALVGGFLPDLSLYAMAGWHLLYLGTPAEIVFRELYYSDLWQQIFAVDNSFVLWGIALALAVWWKSKVAIALTGAALLHLSFDFPLHNDDARMHFWPLTDWKFESPISYWERSRGGDIVEIVENVGVAILTVLLIVRFPQTIWRAVFVGIAALQVVPFVLWRLIL